MGPQSQRLCRFLTVLFSGIFNRPQVGKCEPPIIALDTEGKTTVVTNKVPNVRSLITKSTEVARPPTSDLVRQQTKGPLSRPTSKVPSVPALPESLARLMNETETPLGLHV
jgi:hypothetical protein